MSTIDSTMVEQIQAIPVSHPHYFDNFLVCGILACTFILAIVFSDRKRYFSRLLKEFFLPRESTIEGIRTTNIVYQRLVMYFVSFGSIALFFALYASDRLLGNMGYGVLWLISCVSIVLFHLLRRGIFAITNRIFFDPATTKMWEQSYACWIILSSVPLFVLSVIVLFLNIPSQTALLLLTICIALLEMCLLYKAFHIFSVKKYGILQIFIYLCTLELMPLLLVGKALVLFA